MRARSRKITHGFWRFRTAHWNEARPHCRKLEERHCHKLKKLDQSNRTEIIWTSGNIAQFNKFAPKWVQRILTAGWETGLLGADLVKVKMD
ncbi:hypothetical protein NBRC116601_17520 [Cognatishimia sp. WU-CL00825]